MISSKLTLVQWKALINHSSDHFSLKVISGSMLPVLQIGDEVLISPINRLPAKGEVTVFFREDLEPQLVVHRCLGGLKFSGDNTFSYDQGVEEKHVLGVVYQFRRDGELKTIVQKVPRFKSLTMFTGLVKFRLKQVVKKGLHKLR
ncbi:MAG: S24/S26 family peptidase [Lentisphaeria bacterium]|nr:S24/S26 family peptidase [Lentisphaeria bacterium]